MSEFTFLTKEQIDILDEDGIFYKHRKAANITDFAILLGGYVSENNYLKERNGKWWTRSPAWRELRKTSYSFLDEDSPLYSFDEYGGVWPEFHWERYVGARPAFSISSTISKKRKKELEDSGVKEFEYGEYPQTIVNEEYSKELERLYSSNSLIITGRNYTTDSVKVEETTLPFKAKTHIEYEYNGRQYIRFVCGDFGYDYARKTSFRNVNLSDGRKLERGKAYWLAVEPIVWLLDIKADIAFSKKLIFSGVQFENDFDYYGDFEKSDIKKFMDKYLSEEIVAARTYPKVTFESHTQENIESKEPVERQTLNENFANVSEEKIETKIHPYVYAYMAYKAYNEEKLNVEPKTWEIVSKVLYKTKQPDTLRELLGDDLTNDFIAFTNQQVISLEDIINYNYSKEDLEMSVSQKFATAAELFLVDAEYLEKVKDFVKRVDESIKMKTVFENLSDLERWFETNCRNEEKKEASQGKRRIKIKRD